MKTLRKLGTLQQQKDMAAGAEDFGRLVHHILRHRGDFSAARVAANSNHPNDYRGLTTRLVEVLKAAPHGRELSRELFQKAAASAGTLAGSVFADASVIQSGWINSLAAFGIFDRLLADNAMKVIPLMPGTVGAVSVGATAYSVAKAA
jgi:hypothetical protein